MPSMLISALRILAIIFVTLNLVYTEEADDGYGHGHGAGKGRHREQASTPAPSPHCLCPKTSSPYKSEQEYFCEIQINSPECIKNALYECKAPGALAKLSKECDSCRLYTTQAKCKIGGGVIAYDTVF